MQAENQNISGFKCLLPLSSSFSSPFFSFLWHVLQVAQLFLCFQQTSVLSKEPLLFWNVMLHMTPESTSGTSRLPECLFVYVHAYFFFKPHGYHVSASLELNKEQTARILSLPQLQVGSRWYCCPSEQRRPCVCSPRLPHNWPDLVR